jgi:dienelactone hydrolase
MPAIAVTAETGRDALNHVRFKMGEFAMRFVSVLVLAIATMVAQVAGVSSARADWIELPAESGQPKVYVNVVKTPVAGRAPVALMLHGGSGLTRGTTIALEGWAEWLAQRGISSVIIDSYRGRGIKGGSDIPDSKMLAVVRGRITDTQRTLTWLSTQDWADPSRAFIFGVSIGGSIGILAVTEKQMPLPQVQLYPYCPKALSGMINPKQGYPPSLWVAGEKDELSLLAETQQCAAKIAAAGNPGAVKVVVAAGAQHGFDRSPREVTYSSTGIATSKVEIEAFLWARGLMR